MTGECIRDIRFERERGVYDVRVEQDVAHLVVRVPAGDDRNAAMSRILATLSASGIAIFLTKLHSDSLTFAVAGTSADAAETALTSAGYECDTRRQLAIISVIAASIRDLTGVLVQIIDALRLSGAKIEAVGDSHNSVQCLIDGSHVEAAAAGLRAEFHLEADHA